MNKEHNKEVKWRESGKDIDLLKEQWENSKNYKSYNYNIKKKLMTFLKVIPIIILLIMIFDTYLSTVRPITIELNVWDTKNNELKDVYISRINPKYKDGKIKITSNINSKKEIIISKENYRPDTLQIKFDRNKSTTVILKRYYTLTIQAKYPTGDLAKNEDVRIIGENREVEGLTDSEGEFPFKLLEGQYTVIMSGNKINVNLNKNINKAVTTYRVYTLSVIVKDYNNKTKNNEEIKIYKNDDLIRTIISNNTGEQDILLIEGIYKIKVLGKTETVELNSNKIVTVKQKYTLTYLKTNNNGYKEYKNKKDGSTLIYIPAGEFTMGSNDGSDNEKPVHIVYLDGYYISKYEITNKQYKQFCDKTGRDYPKDPGFSGMRNYINSYPNYPVVNMSWNDAVSYCKWAGLRLPTEAEWEKGARGTDSRKYPWGRSSPGTNKANYDLGANDADGYEHTSPVGNYSSGASPYGLMDMAGNVREWVNDWYDSGYYSSSPKSNPKGPSSGYSRVLRGGSLYRSDDYIRSSYRNFNIPTYYWFDYGFRPVF